MISVDTENTDLEAGPEFSGSCGLFDVYNSPSDPGEFRTSDTNKGAIKVLIVFCLCEVSVKIALCIIFSNNM